MSHSKETTFLNKYLFAIIALLIIPISGLSIDIYVPSLPAVSHYFHASPSLTQLTITSYMIGVGVMQLFGGGISDSFGRKKPFLIAMLIYIITTLCVPFSHDIYQLLALRFIQGSVIAILVVPIRSVIPDLFKDRELYKWMNYMTMAWSIGPIIAPAIGGYLQHYAGWKANFYFLAIYSIIVFSLVVVFLPETSTHRHPFHLTKMLRRYIDIMSHWDYFSGLIINGLLYSMIILFSVVSPFLIQTVLHYSAVEFGQIALLMGLAWFIGTMTNRLMIDIDFAIKTKITLSLMLVVSIVMAAMAIFLPMNLYYVVVPFLILLFLGGILFPNYFARAVSLYPEMTGSANALFGSFVFLISSASSVLGALLKSTTQVPLTVTVVILIALCLMISQRQQRKDASMSYETIRGNH